MSGAESVTVSRWVEFLSNHWRDAVQILILAVLVYQAYVYFRATRAARILTGLLLVLICLTLASAALNLDVIEWLLKSRASSGKPPPRR